MPVQPEHEDKELEKRMVEYAALEARMQNDSSISYALFVGFAAASIAFLSGILSLYYDKRIDILVVLPLFVVSFMLLIAGEAVRRRFDYAGQIRMARAVEIEEQYGFYSFRLLEPWKKPPNDEYLRILGELASKKPWDGYFPTKNEFINRGRHHFNNPPIRVSKILDYSYGMVFLVISVYSGVILGEFLWEFYDHDLGSLLALSSILLVLSFIVDLYLLLNKDQSTIAIRHD